MIWCKWRVKDASYIVLYSNESEIPHWHKTQPFQNRCVFLASHTKPKKKKRKTSSWTKPNWHWLYHRWLHNCTYVSNDSKQPQFFWKRPKAHATHARTHTQNSMIITITHTHTHKKTERNAFEWTKKYWKKIWIVFTKKKKKWK